MLNWLIAPIFWQLTHLPVLCDMIGTSLFIITLWWTRKPGAVSFMGIVATLLNFILRPEALHFFGFTVGSIIFDLLAFAFGYRKFIERGLMGSAILVSNSLVSTCVAGVIIGSFFMNPAYLSSMFGGVAFFAILHGAGGLVGGVLGIIIVRGLETRVVVPNLQ